MAQSMADVGDRAVEVDDRPREWTHAASIKAPRSSADSGVMDVCAQCGAGLAPGAAWCSLCMTPRGTAPLPPTQPLAPVGGQGGAAATPQALVQRTRYGHSETTFGLKGRIVMTILLLLPIGLFAFTLTMGFGIVGMVIWGGVVVPWGMRDIWKSSHGRGLSAAVAPQVSSAERFGGHDQS